MNKTIFFLTVVISTLFSAIFSFAETPHFVKSNANIDRELNLDISFKEAGLIPQEPTRYYIAAETKTAYSCLYKGGKCATQKYEFTELLTNDVSFEAAKNGTVNKDDLIMLNITGGGEDKFKAKKELFQLKPRIVFDINPDAEEIQKRVALLFA